MKSVLYVAAALMIGASIYGFVDYSKTKGSKEFDSMYEEKKTADLVIVEERKPVSDVAPAVKTGPSRKVKEEKVETVKVSKVNVVKKSTDKLKKKRKINYKSFSRAPLKEEEEVIEELPAAKEVTIKEQ
jgi:hypothetical protein